MTIMADGSDGPAESQINPLYFYHASTALDTCYLYYASAALALTMVEGERLDYNYDEADIHPDSRAKHREVCRQFLARFPPSMLSRNRIHTVHWHGDLMEYAGEDLWRTRNRHKSGFDTGHWDESFATRATEYCRRLGECRAHVGNGGLVSLG